MNELLELQENFQNHLLQTDSKPIDFVVNTKKVKAKTRLAIYSYSYQWRLVEALSTTYPVLKKYLGEKKFNRLALEYVQKYPSEFRSIRWYGDQLAEFLKTVEDSHSSLFTELVQFEWILADVFDAKDHAILSMEHLAKIPIDEWPFMTFSAHPSIRRLNLHWNVAHIWQALDQNQSKPKAKKNAEPINWIFWRKELLNQYCSLSYDEAWAIDALLKGKSFNEICEGLCKWIDESQVATHAVGLLKGWIVAGLIVDVNINFS
jgi:hypothetical protein